MSNVDVHDMNREKVGEIDLPDAVFNTEVKDHLLFAVVRYQRAKARQGTHSVRNRSAVRGGGKKPYRQKGTGRARQGTTRAPQWRGGGVVFGPTPRSYAFKLNKKVRRAALRCALSRRMQENALVVVDALDLEAPKTREFKSFLTRFELTDALVVGSVGENARLSARNLQEVTVLPAEGLNVMDVLRRRNLVLTKDAVEALAARLGG
jgi:large subunit ribosomal protein L4